MADIRIRAQKGSIPCIFSVDLLRTPYFFKDRDTKVNVNGVKKRIFHIVRTHKRKFKNGREIFVKSHFRGLRHFRWNDYNVTITMPGFHHRSLQEFGAAGHVMEGDAVPSGFADSRQTGKILKKATVV